MSVPAAGVNILVADDDSVIREIVHMHLAAANFIVSVVEDGEAALAQVLLSPPDLIITDISMPRLDGFELLEAIRANPATAFIPIILLSQHSDVSVFRRGMELGADDFLAKPVKRIELMNSVNARLTRVGRMARNRGPQAARNQGITTLPPRHSPAALDISRPATGTIATTATASTLPTVSANELDGYRLIKKIGEGGMSQVFLAERADSGERHVLKLARIAKGDDGHVLQRFVDEYALVSQISHPNVAKIFHQGFSETYAYIAMEYFPKGDLRHLMKQHEKTYDRLTPDTAVAILIQVASALDAVHHIGVVHRDMKPDNIMLREDGSLALADFGIAKHSQERNYKTAHGEVFGTPVYIAPEQATGQHIDHRADIYSLGAMFFELLTGSPPYKADSAQTMLEQHVRAPLPSLPPTLCRFAPLLDRMLAKRRDDRPDSALDIVAELAGLFSVSAASFALAANSEEFPKGDLQPQLADSDLVGRIRHAAEITLSLAHGKPRQSINSTETSGSTL